MGHSAHRGGGALLREFLRTKRDVASPSAALLKAPLIAGARRLPGTASSKTFVDNHQGFGRVNLDQTITRPLATIDGPRLKTGTWTAEAVASDVSAGPPDFGLAAVLG